MFITVLCTKCLSCVSGCILLINFAVITVIMIMLTISIRTEEMRFIEMKRQDDSNRSSPFPRDVAANLERSRKMFYQAIFYVFAFYLTWYVQRKKTYVQFNTILRYSCFLFVRLVPTMHRISQLISGKSYFFLMLGTAIFLPLQGFFNFLVCLMNENDV